MVPNDPKGMVSDSPDPRAVGSGSPDPRGVGSVSPAPHAGVLPSPMVIFVWEPLAEGRMLLDKGTTCTRGVRGERDGSPRCDLGPDQV